MGNSINLPRYGGLSNVHTPGISVEEAGQRLRRLAYAEERLMRLFASRVVLLESRELKLLLARFQFESAQQADALRNRVTELRLSKNKLKKSPAKALTILFDEADHLPEVYPFLAGVVEVLLPGLVSAYKEYLDETNDLADYPSVRVIRQNRSETEDHLALLSQAYQALTPSEQENELAAEWIEHLLNYLDTAGGILGFGEQAELAPRFGAEKFVLPHDINRDETFERVWDFEKPDKDEIEDYLHYMMSIRLSEINVAEGLAFVLLETEDMPWSFYLDISRHLWDEMRHSIFGEVAIEDSFGDRAALPMRDYEGVYAYQADPLEQYATLGLEIEGKG